VWRPPSLRRLRKLRLSRRWRQFFIALCGVASVGLVIVALAPRLAGLYLLGLYCIPSNSILPIPHEPGVLYMARWYPPWEIAIAATVASAVVAFADYALVELAMRHPRIQGARDARMMRWAVKWMTRFPFAIIVAFSLVPLLPISIVRALAPISGYPLRRYIAALVVGRLPRFFLLAWLGNAVTIPTWVLLLVTAATLAMMILGSPPTPAVDDEELPGAEEILVPDLTDPAHPIDPSESTRLRAAE
jgi:membrane protein YqaA with SNARE-associated domain